MTSTANPRQPATDRRRFAAPQAGLSLLAAAVFLFRAVRTSAGDGLPAGEPTTTGVLLAVTATVLSVGAAAVALRSARLAAVPLSVVLALELLALGDHVAPPRLLAAIPLIGALALALAPGVRPSTVERSPTPSVSPAHLALTVLSLVLMAPIGFVYLTTGLVAPAPDVFGAYALFGLFVAVAVHLTRRRRWWVLAVPPVAAGAWFLMLWLGETFWGWSA